MTGLFSECLSPRLRGMALFVLAYMGAGLAYALYSGNTEFVFYCGAVAVYILLVMAMDRRVRFSGTVLWMLAAWGMLHMAGGLVPIPPARTDEGLSPVLYNFYLVPGFPKYDKFIHAFGFGVSVLAAWEGMSAHFGRRLPVDLATAVILTLIGMGLGALNEVLEFIAVLMIPDTNVGGYENTCWDLVSNLIGAVMAVLFLRFGPARPTSPV